MPVTLPSPSPPPAPQIFPLISQSRWLVKSGELTDLEFSVSPGLRRKLNTRPVHLHLFNDCLLLSRPRESVTGAGGRSTGGAGGMGEATEGDEKGQGRVVLLEEPLSMAQPKESRSQQRKEEHPEQKRQSHQGCHKFTQQDQYHVTDTEQSIASQLLHS